jgi:hypothetical protein
VLADRSGKAGERDYRALVVRSALQALADGQSDVDAYIALVPPEERRMPHQGAEIGRRLLAAGRAADAIAALERARPKRSAAKAARDDDFYLVGLAADDAWEATYIEALEATGRQDEAQRLRWAAFEERLSADQLRAYLKRLPDFDDVEAEERAMKHALGFRSFSAALGFFTDWPDQARAAELVLARASEINGNLYHLLDPAARRTRSMARSPPATSTPPGISSSVGHSRPASGASGRSRRTRPSSAACAPGTAGRPASGAK